MPFLRQSTAQTVRFGPFLDITDGVSEEVSLTLAQADMRLSKDGGAFAQKNASGNATHDSDGWYSTSLDATDTATVGELVMNVHQPANTLPVWMRWWVVEEAVYDAHYGAAAAGPLQSTVAARTLDVTAAGEAGIDLDNTVGTIGAAQIATDAITAAKIAADAIGASELATDAIGSAQLATTAVNEIRDAILPIINTAFSNIPVFMALSSDHVSAATGLTLTITRSIDGGAFGSGTGTAAEIANGAYQYDASAADMNGTFILFRFTGTAADDNFVVIRTGG